MAAAAGSKKDVMDMTVEELRAEVLSLRDLTSIITHPAHPMLGRQTSDIAGKTVDITEMELKLVRKTFDKLADGSERLTMERLVEASAKLGEPVSEEDVEEALLFADAGETLDFAAFCLWWDEIHKPDAPGKSRRGARYARRFKLAFAKLEALDAAAAISCFSSGDVNTLDYRVHFQHRAEDGTETPISPWHDVPLRNADGSFNFVCEIPKWSRAKMEIATGEPLNPIKQDVKNGGLRFYRHGDMMFNYGAFPQTWEDPKHVTPDTGFGGDNDPVDVIEIGARAFQTGTIEPVKVLGVLALIDSDETDWKIIAISCNDVMCDRLNDIGDVEYELPGLIDRLREWLRDYKICTGKPPNAFGLDGRAMPASYALDVVEETHAFWKELIASERKEV